ncbi:MAG: hypothetical protein A3C13_01355 [Candidatus Lloydbacteria bacterium RIFCSPHIGHO2_02_FULL_50_11]|nr:MAG: hypothetical protein A3C13_01355 [Candidatus Lloydbacteria bacterium RIFCSPHIGHO2_02_FULL_50_11]
MILSLRQKGITLWITWALMSLFVGRRDYRSGLSATIFSLKDKAAKFITKNGEPGGETGTGWHGETFCSRAGNYRFA